jgi:hypothetical protein
MQVRLRASDRHRHLLELSREMGKALLAGADAPFEEVESLMRGFEKRMLEAAGNRWERSELKRRVAETLFTEAFGRNESWPVLGRMLRRIQRLGYSHVERRFHVAALYALWSREHPEHARQARGFLEEAERRALRLPRNHVRRKQIMGSIADIRARAGFVPPQPPPKRKRRSP